MQQKSLIIALLSLEAMSLNTQDGDRLLQIFANAFVDKL